MRQARLSPFLEIIDEFFAGEIDIVEKGHIAGQQLRSAGVAALDQVDGREEAGP